ncbi:Uma2 family endonuclease [Pararhizobium haloflavum]|uniref:Uma2 family endonuclease n=1 Tax=Pararhizobium haloflavum TaxID=2037914 RepID=UPI0012FFED8B|nr:Uma2 family endonuclease [Pararhizobium haloflavum]
MGCAILTWWLIAVPPTRARAAVLPAIVVEVSSPGTLAVDVTDKLDEYQRHGDIRIIMLVEPDVLSVKVYRRGPEGRWDVEKYDALDQLVALPEIGTTIALAVIYDTLEPAPRPSLRVVDEAPD